MNRLSVSVFASAALLAASAASAQDWAKARVEKSPRHLEWVSVRHGDRVVRCFIGFPEVKGKATAVVVIHEIFGHTDWVQNVVDRLAEAGYIAIAPDLLSGMAPGGGGSVELGGNVRQVIGSLPPDQITADLGATVEYVRTLPAGNGKVVVGGFCWGGRQTFRFACNNKDIKAGFVFYGDTPSEKEIARIGCPIYGFYGGNDARITANVPETAAQMKAAGKIFEPATYDGAGHGFMRSGEDPANTNPANRKGRDEGWARWLDLLKRI
ncbi:MAG: carboxymethylenebutenolidase [Verrucomicrobia bacterium RIFCSPLOWO2_12_FULL_64_8]|nr:MAG: carboxymethylenebutenolidase [Verrucomicrobia bacterium RIFCSPLOWO2_12_FULL_64_8]